MGSLGSGCRMQLGKDNSSLLERAAWSCREHIGLSGRRTLAVSNSIPWECQEMLHKRLGAGSSRSSVE